jgi:hypothetical protein
MSEPITRLVIVAIDHITLRWENEDINPVLALALGIVMNDRAGQALPEVNKAITDLLIHGAGFCRVGAEKTKHIPFHDFLQSS